MRSFDGFQDSDTIAAISDRFFAELFPAIEEPAELKIVLHALWSVGRMEGAVHALTDQDFAAAELGLGAEQIQSGLELAIRDKILLRSGKGNAARYFLNSPRGRAAAAGFADGSLAESGVSSPPMERPNAFKAYEENIGPLTPMVADAIKDAEAAYPAEWVLEAIGLAVRNNKRSWSYCEAILRRWKEEGRGKKQNRRDDQAARQRDVEEKIKRFIRG